MGTEAHSREIDLDGSSGPRSEDFVDVVNPSLACNMVVIGIAHEHGLAPLVGMDRVRVDEVVRMVMMVMLLLDSLIWPRSRRLCGLWAKSLGSRTLASCALK